MYYFAQFEWSAHNSFECNLWKNIKKYLWHCL